MTARVALAVALAAALPACEGAIGTIDVELVTAPGADPLADVTRVRLTLDEPSAVVEAERDPGGGFELELEVTAEGLSGFATFEGFDADGDVLAWGRSGALPIAAIDAAIKIYVAAPNSLAEAPVELDPPRSEIGVATLPYGALWAGGRGADGAPLDTLTIYNVYSHDFQEGEPLPEARAGVAAASGLFNFVYLFGGEDADGDTPDAGWRFDTQAPPAGLYRELSETAGHGRRGADLALFGYDGGDLMLVTGDPPIYIDGLFAQVRDLTDAPALGGLAATLIFDELAVETLIAGDGAGTGGAVLYDTGMWVDLAAPAGTQRTGHAVINLANGDALILAGANGDGPLASAVRYRRQDRSFEVIDDFLATPRRDAAVARSGNRILVAGGTDAGGAVVGDAEVFDAQSLARIGTLPMRVPRTGAGASPLGNGQIIVAGGVDGDGAPIAALELYTPD